MRNKVEYASGKIIDMDFTTLKNGEVHLHLKVLFRDWFGNQALIDIPTIPLLIEFNNLIAEYATPLSQNPSFINPSIDFPSASTLLSINGNITNVSIPCDEHGKFFTITEIKDKS